MDKVKINNNKNPNGESGNKQNFQKVFYSFVREFLAIFIWGYTITKLFIFDIDIFLIERFSPSYIWIVQYKFFIFIGVATLIWLATRNKTIILWTLFILFYPLIVFVWKIPLFIYKIGNWNLAFAYLDSIISFIKSFRITFIAASFFLITTTIILVAEIKIILWISLILLALIIFTVYLQRISLALKPSGIYQTYVRFFSFAVKNTRDLFGKAILDENASKISIENMDDKQLEKWTSNVQQLVFVNRICLFVAKGLKSYQQSGINIVSLIINILFLFLYTVFSFAVIHYGLFKIDSNLYSFSHSPTFFTFFYYSFNLLLFNSIQEITAVAPLSQITLMVEYFFGLFLVAIFVSLVLSVKSQKYADELNEAIKTLTEEGNKVEQHIKDQFDLNNISDALEALQKVKSSIVELLYAMTKSIG